MFFRFEIYDIRYSTPAWPRTSGQLWNIFDRVKSHLISNKMKKILLFAALCCLPMLTGCEKEEVTVTLENTEDCPCIEGFSFDEFDNCSPDCTNTEEIINVPDEEQSNHDIMIIFKDGVREDDVDRFIENLPAKIVKHLESENIYHIQLLSDIPDSDFTSFVVNLNKIDIVSAAIPDQTGLVR